MTYFHSNIISLYGDNGQKWLDNLPQTIEKVTKKYALTDVQTGMKDVPLSFNYIFFAKYKNTDAVIKLSPNIKDSKRETEALRHFNGMGMVKLLAAYDNIIIMERAEPGIILEKNNPRSIEIACNCLTKLHSANTNFNKSYFPTIEEWLKPIDLEWNYNPDIIRQARKYKEELLPQYNKRILLHGDLHHDNILKHGNGYVAIDPKGLIGDPINDMWNLVTDFEQDTIYIANHFNYKLSDIRKWYFIHLVLAICWGFEDNIYPEKFIAIAEKISNKLS